MQIRSQILEAVQSYRKGAVSIDQFENWFRDSARTMFAYPPDVLSAFVSIDNAFSDLRSGGLTREEFLAELAEAIRPFEQIEPCVERGQSTSQKILEMEKSTSEGLVARVVAGANQWRRLTYLAQPAHV